MLRFHNNRIDILSIEAAVCKGVITSGVVVQQPLFVTLFSLTHKTIRLYIILYFTVQKAMLYQRGSDGNFIPKKI